LQGNRSRLRIKLWPNGELMVDLIPELALVIGRQAPIPSAPSIDATGIDSHVARLDAATIVKAAQILSSEMHLPSVIERFVSLAVEHAGAERGLLVLVHESGPRIEAEARAGGGPATGTRHGPVTPADLPQSVLHYVLRTRQRVLFDDASCTHPDSDDEYMRRNRPRSVLCLPIFKQTRVIGALYLENNVTSYAFTADRIALLDVLASQAAILLENDRLYADLRRNEALMAEAQRLSSTGSFHWRVATDDISWSKQMHHIFGIDPAMAPTLELIASRLHPEDLPLLQEMVDRGRGPGSDLDCKLRLQMPGGTVKYIHLIAHRTRDEDGHLEYIGAVQDVTESRFSEEALGRARSELAHLARVSSLGTLTASIAHDVNQPLSGIVTNANTCVRMLDADPPNLNGARETARRIVRDTDRASGVVARLRAQNQTGRNRPREPLRTRCGRGFRASTCRQTFRAVLHNQEWRHGHRTIRQSLHY